MKKAGLITALAVSASTGAYAAPAVEINWAAITKLSSNSEYQVASIDPAQKLFEQQQRQAAPLPTEFHPVHVEEPQEKKYLGGKFMGSVSLVSDYVYRGMSETQEAPGIQAMVDYMHDSGIKIGIAGMNVNMMDASSELDVYAAYAKPFGNATLEGGIVYYAYPGADSDNNYDYMEFYGLASYSFDPVTVAASLNYSPDFFAGSGAAFYPRLAASAQLPYDFTVDGWVGYQYIDDEMAFGMMDYADWALGLGYTYDDFTIKAQYVDTNLDEMDCPDICDAKAVFTVSKAFD